VKSRGIASADIGELSAQVRPLGLELVEIPSDGNCLFGAVADQLENDPGRHKKYRDEVVNYLENHADDFMPFITTTLKGYQKYCDNMRKNGAWGGQPELVAVSQYYKADITLHQVGRPANKLIEAHPKAEHQLHLAYHTKGHEHYNSVRPVGTTAQKGSSSIPQQGVLQPSNASNKRKAEDQGAPVKAAKQGKENKVCQAQGKAATKSVAENKKVAANEQPAKKTTAKKATAKKAVDEKKSAKKVTAKKAAPKKVTAKKAAPKKATAKKAAPKKATAKKATAKKATAKKATAKKATAKKATAKKAAPKKATAKKATAKTAKR